MLIEGKWKNIITDEIIYFRNTQHADEFALEYKDIKDEIYTEKIEIFISENKIIHLNGSDKFGAVNIFFITENLIRVGHQIFEKE